MQGQEHIAKASIREFFIVSGVKFPLFPHNTLASAKVRASDLNARKCKLLAFGLALPAAERSCGASLSVGSEISTEPRLTESSSVEFVDNSTMNVSEPLPVQLPRSSLSTPAAPPAPAPVPSVQQHDRRRSRPLASIMAYRPSSVRRPRRQETHGNDSHTRSRSAGYSSSVNSSS
eukprot:6207355-Pleurochrysis_carterae.AAC.1